MQKRNITVRLDDATVALVDDDVQYLLNRGIVTRRSERIREIVEEYYSREVQRKRQIALLTEFILDDSSWPVLEELVKKHRGRLSDILEGKDGKDDKRIQHR